MKMTSVAAVVLAEVALLPGALAAQTVSDVQFEAGNYGAMISGSIIGDEYIDYRLGASGGQQLYVEMMPVQSEGAIYFNILPPGSEGEAIYNSSIDGDSTTVTLPSDGTYTLRVYQMGGAADSGAIASFNIDVSIQ